MVNYVPANIPNPDSLAFLPNTIFDFIDDLNKELDDDTLKSYMRMLTSAGIGVGSGHVEASSVVCSYDNCYHSFSKQRNIGLYPIRGHKNATDIILDHIWHLIKPSPVHYSYPIPLHHIDICIPNMNNTTLHIAQCDNSFSIGLYEYAYRFVLSQRNTLSEIIDDVYNYFGYYPK